MLGQPLPWPRYTKTFAPCAAAFTFAQVALGVTSFTTLGVYFRASAAMSAASAL